MVSETGEVPNAGIVAKIAATAMDALSMLTTEVLANRQERSIKSSHEAKAGDERGHQHGALRFDSLCPQTVELLGRGRVGVGNGTHRPVSGEGCQRGPASGAQCVRAFDDVAPIRGCRE